jgi:stearoyl-CoA desaturase (Delta-9 desaturase)
MVTRFTASALFKLLGILSLHGIVLLALLNEPEQIDWLVFAAVYPFAAIGVGVSMHRYFAHRAFKTSRWFQFVLAIMAALAFGNAVHFAGKHRLHHKYSDQPGDVHSPKQGLWYSWIGSMLNCGYSAETIEKGARDFLRYPELEWLYRNSLLPALLLNSVLFLVGGFSMMAIGGCLSSVLLLHQSSAVNYFCHLRGYKSYETKDNSRNNFIVAVLTFGEGWHNNHHRYPGSAKAGMRWWEVDMFYWVILLLEAMGLIWDVKRVRRNPLLGEELVLKASNGE